jgi:putative DNA primase/helicase
MTEPQASLDEIDALLRDDVINLVSYLTGSPPNNSLSKKGEARFGRNGGIAVTTMGKDKGRITAFDGDSKGRSPINFIQYYLNLEFREAIKWAKNWLGMDDDYRPDPKAEKSRRQTGDKDRAQAENAENQERQRKISHAETIVNAAIPVAGTSGEAYLRGRAITTSLPKCILYSPSPSALAVVATTATGTVQAVQRVFLDGNRKANIDVQKRTNGPLKNAALRLPGNGHRLYISEGPETALSVWQATDAPTWAVLGQNFRNHDIPNGITEIVIAADNDAEGSTAFKQTKKSADHYHQRGYPVFVARPEGPPKCDFNDVHQEQGTDAVRSILETASRWVGAPALYKPPVGTIDEARRGASSFITEWVDQVIKYWKRKAEYDGGS